MVRFAHTSDWHIYDKHKYSSEGERLKEIIANCSEIIEGAAAYKSDLLIIAGDIFHHYNPSERLLQYFAALMTKALSLNLKVRIIIGQHDTNGTNWSLQSLMTYLDEMYRKMGLSSELFEEYLKIYPSGEVFQETIENTTFWYVSWALNAEELIKSIEPYNEYNVLVAHAGILGVKTPSGYLKKRGYMDPGVLKDFDYVAMGDFHNGQVIGGNIHYSGAPVRFRWDERDNELGYNLVEMGKEPIRIPLVDMQMIETTMSAKDIGDDMMVEVDGKAVKGAVLKINVTGVLTDSKLVKLKSGLYDAGARQVYVKTKKDAITLLDDGLEIAGMSIIDMIKSQKLEKKLKTYGVEFATQI